MSLRSRHCLLALLLLLAVLYIVHLQAPGQFDAEWDGAKEYLSSVSHRTAPLANATLLVLAREGDLDGVLASMRGLENRFNRNYHYPWVFLSEVEFSEAFKANVSEAASSPVEFGLIPPEHWYMPDWIDAEKADREMAQLATVPNIPYAKSIPYRNMCRFNAGFFYRHPLLLKYKYYWRVEPNVLFRCNIDFDPLQFMVSHNKTYGFVIGIKEIKETVTTLWQTTKEFMEKYPQYIPEKSTISWVANTRTGNYNLCHYWSNFEIADMDFWRGEAYSAYFDYLDQAGGFYYERWGDAPVHSIGASILLPPTAFHFFDRIGYTHQPFTHCPRLHEDRQVGLCDCGERDSVDTTIFSCTGRWLKIMNRLTPGGGWRDVDDFSYP
ncbi:glycosyl transferase [Punctularia strigosozonata HHB-11173 SS5]|uniref:glycosyl transferase n=1 Tax=Punctularia strigosozonata (strain HHB-11173) TaxID=741275 RepID=UPI00044181D0|nr:glycosyl transferase [Punctularia strigosozonata HHB-11173 SS5]EIN08953.1 glycosyl transferase [Punctularia strigosozonata HHB-11173 SS5]